MNKTYEQKVTDLLSAADELLSVLPHESNALQNLWGELDALQAACRAINVPVQIEPAPVFVFVRGGVVTLVSDETGETMPAARVIDFDGYDAGECPVCRRDFDDGAPCQNCGYSAFENNALECAVKYFSDRKEPTAFDREMSIPTGDEQELDPADFQPMDVITILSEQPEIDAETVTLIASGYEFICPHCETYNRVIETAEKVTCGECGHTFIVDECIHAEG